MPPVVATIVAVAGIVSFRQALHSGQRLPRGTMYRTLGGTACYVTEMMGALVLFLGSSVGLYIAAVAMVSNFYFMISGSWLLLVCVSKDESSSA